MDVIHVQNIRARIARIGVTHGRVAELAGYDRTVFSRSLSRQRPPEEFVERVTRVLDALEEAEREAELTRRRVLSGHGVVS